MIVSLSFLQIFSNGLSRPVLRTAFVNFPIGAVEIAMQIPTLIVGQPPIGTLPRRGLRRLLRTAKIARRLTLVTTRPLALHLYAQQTVRRRPSGGPCRLRHQRYQYRYDKQNPHLPSLLTAPPLACIDVAHTLRVH
jgi:hypothetical protein